MDYSVCMMLYLIFQMGVNSCLYHQPRPKRYVRTQMAQSFLMGIPGEYLHVRAVCVGQDRSTVSHKHALYWHVTKLYSKRGSVVLTVQVSIIRLVYRVQDSIFHINNAEKYALNLIFYICDKTAMNRHSCLIGSIYSLTDLNCFS